MYRVPNSNAKISMESYLNIINKLKSIKANIILGTDQNFDFLKYNKDKNTKDLLEGFMGGDFIPAITKPTRTTHLSATLLDNLYLKDLEFYSNLSGIINCDISDRLPIFSCVGKQIHSTPGPSHCWGKTIQ